MSWFSDLICRLFPCTCKRLKFFGYVSATDEASLTRVSAYTNIVDFGTNLTDTTFQDTMDCLQRFHQLAIINIAPICWDFSVSPPKLLGNWLQNWLIWSTKYSASLIPTRVLAITQFDEPSGAGIDMAGYEQVCKAIKTTLPWLQIFHVDGISPASFTNIQKYVLNGGKLPNVDIITIDDYSIHPANNANFLSIVAFYKTHFPGRKWLYVLDGFWDANHAAAFGNDIAIMGQIAQEWYAFAKADKDAIGLGTYIWTGGAPEWTDSENFPASVLQQHRLIGQTILT